MHRLVERVQSGNPREMDDPEKDGEAGRVSLDARH